MSERLTIAEKLLSPSGVIAISIGFHEVNNLMLLCQDIFSSRQVVCVTVQTSSGNAVANGFTVVQEYIVFITLTSLHFATNAKMIGSGLDEQLEKFVREHSDTKLIIVDTLQKVRGAVSDSYSYSSDYDVIGKMKQFADRYKVCILIVHYTRKQPAGDSFEMISGTTGLPWLCGWGAPDAAGEADR